MDTQDIRSLAGELEATMGLVNGLVNEVRAGADADRVRERVADITEHLARRPELPELPALLIRAYSEIMDALGGIRQSREALQSFALERLRKNQNKLAEVSSATESATLSLMDGLDRSLGLIDGIQEMVRTDNPASPSGEAFDHLRDELNQLFGYLQFQDITSQQLAGVGALLEDIEQRVLAAARLFNRGVDAVAADDPAAAFNGEASFQDVASRQAAIDAAFAKRNPISAVA
jgi:hypothetical protein